MDSVMTKKGQVVIPVALRRKYGMDTGTRVVWIDTGSVIKLVPIPKEPLTALRGCSEGEDLTMRLLRAREEERRLEG